MSLWKRGPFCGKGDGGRDCFVNDTEKSHANSMSTHVRLEQNNNAGGFEIPPGHRFRKEDMSGQRRTSGQPTRRKSPPVVTRSSFCYLLLGSERQRTLSNNGCKLDLFTFRVACTVFSSPTHTVHAKLTSHDAPFNPVKKNNLTSADIILTST